MATGGIIMLDEALTYAGRGLPVFPCKPDKRPLVSGGFKSATTDPATITAWWTQAPAALIGMPTGADTDLHVVDVDVHSHDGFATLKKLDLSLDNVPKVQTPSGGNHLYHRLGGRSLRNTAGKLGPGIDTRGSGGYVILPPSRPDPKKPPYAFVNGCDLLAAPLIPDELVKLLSGGKPTPQQQLGDECARVAAAPEGTRNDILNRSAFRLAKLVGTGGLTETDIRETLTKAALKAGLGIGEIENTLASAFAAGKRESRTKPEAEDRKQGRALKLPEPTPWEEEVNGAQLLDGLVGDLRAYLIVSDEQAHAAALWAVHAHVFEVSLITPRLALTSPVPGCGKTTALDWLARVVPRRLEAANISTSATFRAIEVARPTLLVDEADTFLKDNDELRGVLNSGHRKGGSVIRTVGEDFEPRMFSTWCPVCIALIGRLPATLHDRSIEIALRRRLPGETVQSLHGGRDDEHELARMAARWAQDNRDALAHSEPELPEALVNRMADNWRPLFAIAELAGGKWPKRAEQAALKLCAVEEVRSLGLQLLDDIRTIFADHNGGRDLLQRDEPAIDKLATASIIADLILDPEKPWADYRHGKNIQPRQLAGLLKPFRIVSRDLRPPGSKTAVKGYLLADLREAFDRYLAPFRAEHST